MEGMYGLQSPVGTKDHHTGGLASIKDDIRKISGIKTDGNFRSINAAIAYRSWDRKKYPDFNFFGYVTNYMSDMYEFTKGENGSTGIQILTPPLYNVFTDPQVEDPENDIGNDREVDENLFEEFVLTILNAEVEIVQNSVEDKKDIINILMDQDARPLGGWYLDDEPLVRNHDIQVIEKMAEEIRRIEKDFFSSNKLFMDLPYSEVANYYHNRFIAFDCDDLHGHQKAFRKSDGKVYNRDGKSMEFSDGKIYTVFSANTYDVLLPDFYKQDIRFWGKIISEIRYEFTKYNRSQPLLMPVISMQIRKEDLANYTLDYYKELFDFLHASKVNGILTYVWNPGNPDYYGAKNSIVQFNK